MKVYWTSIEFDIPDPPSYKNCIGGFVYLFLKANDVLEAIPRIEKAIEDEGFKIYQVEFIEPYEDIPWETKDDQRKYDSLAQETKLKDDIVWDEIFAYESKDEES